LDNLDVPDAVVLPESAPSASDELAGKAGKWNETYPDDQVATGSGFF
jgi:hypothetical protein